MRSILRKAAVLAVGAAALTAALAVPASADPAGPTTFAAVGSDTIEYLQNHLCNGYNVANPGACGSWDALNPTTKVAHEQILIKSGQPTIQRPNGSSEGITALKNISYVDIARSSRGPRAGDTDPVTTNPLQFVRVAQDTVQYALSAAGAPGSVATNGVLTLSAAQLKTVYQTVGITWNDPQVGGTSPTAIVPMLPQSGSGTRAFFLSSIGVDDCVLNTTTCLNGYRSDVTIVQEHDPAPIQGNADALAPFSLARFRTLPTPVGIQLDDPLSGYSAVRFVYNVIRNAGTVAAPAVPAALTGFIGTFAAGSTTTITGGYICSTAGQNQITADGFDLIPSCGVVDHI